MADAPPLVLFPLSRRIQREIDQLSARHPDVAASRIAAIRMNPFELRIDPEPQALTQCDPDPAHMQRLKVTEEPRPIERPARTEDDLERCTAQFILRNTWRMEAYANPDELELRPKSVREIGQLDDYYDLARRCAFAAGERTPALTSDELRVSVAQRRVLMVETPWHTIFGRAEPTAEPADPQSQS